MIYPFKRWFSIVFCISTGTPDLIFGVPPAIFGWSSFRQVEVPQQSLADENVNDGGATNIDGPELFSKTPVGQWVFQDPKMEVL